MEGKKIWVEVNILGNIRADLQSVYEMRRDGHALVVRSKIHI